MLRDHLFYPILSAAVIGALLLFPLEQGFAQAPADLDASFKAAIERSEAVSIQEELITQAEERASQAKGGLFPVVTGIGSYTRLPAPNGPQTAFTRVDRPEVRVSASQALFRGFREYAAIRQRNLDAAAAEKARDNARILLYGDVAQGFYSVLSLEQDLRDLKSQIDLNQKRVEELETRKRIGRSRLSEVLSVQTIVANLQAQAQAVRGQLDSAREVLSFLTGFERDRQLYDSEPSRAQLPNLDAFLSRLDERPDVSQANFTKRSAEEGISIARGAHLPSVDLGANYYFKRVGVLDSQKWDAQAMLTVPIFAGGVIQSQLREAVSRDRQSDLALSRVRRLAEQEVRSLYKNMQSDIAQLLALAKATSLAERNYSEQSREYKLGLVTNLEVLQGLNNFQETKRALGRANYAAKADFARLEAAVALRGLPATEIKKN